MRSARPIPGNPWPHEMTITVTDDAHALHELLWVRTAWDLQPPGPDLPPEPVGLPSTGPSQQSLRRDKQDWKRAWSTVITIPCHGSCTRTRTVDGTALLLTTRTRTRTDPDRYRDALDQFGTPR